ncbi:MAG: NAD(+)/NADH kinase [Dehalococcoidales bacterium]|nr:NAD(+)/NADH kinase [Dehalococcoidales bacterium]MDP7415422.1 NAD(+)/NADH kinase [Dehalococcoidales bacterium]
MSKVGIIANPASGKDIRRLVAYASVTNNVEKTNILRRIILGIDATGIDEILMMPDYFGLGRRALDGIGVENIRANTSIMDMAINFTSEDSTLAAKLMSRLEVGCIVTLGGDGTNRDVAKSNRTIPLVPLSTGTNNVFPVMTESTSAGIAAGIIARGIVSGKKVIKTHKRLVVIKNDVEIDMALIDAVVLDQLFIGSRAIWQLSEVKEIVCTRAEPNNIGMTCIGGNLHPLESDDEHGLHLKLGKGNLKVKAAVLPGLVTEVGVKELKTLEPGEEVEVRHKPSVIALDGEREITVTPADRVKIRLQRDGPPVVNIEKTIKEAVAKGFFRN